MRQRSRVARGWGRGRGSRHVLRPTIRGYATGDSEQHAGTHQHDKARALGKWEGRGVVDMCIDPPFPLTRALGAIPICT